jgi:NADH dehydrogenase
MKQRILIVGAGFGGMWSALSATRLLDKHHRNDIEVLVLAPQAELRIRPRFYESNVHRMVAPLNALFDAVGVTFVKGTAERIDAKRRVVGYHDAQGTFSELSFDRLILATGSKVVRPPLAGIEHAFDVDEIGEAIRLERHIQSLSERHESMSRNTVVVAGGGFTGIETAAEMPARLRAALGEKADIRVIIVTALARSARHWVTVPVQQLSLRAKSWAWSGV